MRTWYRCKPPNLQTVEVRSGERILRMNAVYADNGRQLCWEDEEGWGAWGPEMFTEWREIIEDQAE